MADLTERFDRALTLVARLHRSQTRKGTSVPYVGHLLGVASMVIEHGGDEDQAIAALLHDAVEDQPEQIDLDEIAGDFGGRVAKIVKECSDRTTGKPSPWCERKRRYLDHLAHASEDALLVSLADKFYNARAILTDYRAHGEDLWIRFNARAEHQLWYYDGLAQVFTRGPPVRCSTNSSQR